jgi:hypothetical protein
MGPMTGRAAGYCAGYPTPGYANPYGGRGVGRGAFGWGAGRGRRNWFYRTGTPGWGRAAYGLPAWGGYAPAYGASYAPPYAAPYGGQPGGQQELDALRGQADYLASTLESVRARIDELEKADKS